MRRRSCTSLAVMAVALLGCRRSPAPSTAASEPTRESVAIEPRSADSFGAPARWQIDGTTTADDPALPVALDRALREHGHAREDVQDHIVVDINGDGRLDAAVLLPAAVTGSYDVLVMLSVGDEVRVHELGALVDHASFTVAVVPLIDGPTLVAAAPRLGSCDRGPSWTFLRATGELLETVGSLAIEPYDCAAAEGQITFVREADGRVTSVELRHGQQLSIARWDAALGSFVVAPAEP